LKGPWTFHDCNAVILERNVAIGGRKPSPSPQVASAPHCFNSWNHGPQNRTQEDLRNLDSNKWRSLDIIHIERRLSGGTTEYPWLLVSATSIGLSDLVKLDESHFHCLFPRQRGAILDALEIARIAAA